MDKDDLQMAWDQFLVKAWYEMPELRVNTAMGIFKGRLPDDVSWDDINQLLRVPTHAGHSRATFRRFVCAYLPKIADALWKHSAADIDRLAVAVNKLKSGVRRSESDSEKALADRAEIVKNVRDSKLVAIKKRGMSNQFAARNRGNQWNVVK